MNFELKTLSWLQAAATPASLLVVLVTKTSSENAQPADGALAALVAQARAAGDHDGAAGKLLQTYAMAGIKAHKVMLVGVGEGSSAALPRNVSKAVAAAVAAFKPASSDKQAHIVISLAALADIYAVDPAAQQAAVAAAVSATVQAAAQASYVYSSTKSKPIARRAAFVTVGVPLARTVQAAFDQSVACVQGVELAKEWANRPGNHATPSMLADVALSLAKGHKNLYCQVLGPKEVAKLGMGSFMAVSQGSAQPLRFIVLRYEGASKTQGTAKGQAPTVLVGKGITFDTGGISIKPAPDMDEMKHDMAGAASVLGVFKALGILKPAINVVGLIPTCENMPDGKAIKPGDVVTSMSGQTIEILNTDAEGRLILCDALTYAERFKPAAVIDIATLTGACVIALGHTRSGLFATDDALATALQSAGEAALDPCWRMPLDDDFAEGLKTNFADVANVAGRAGGAITAAKFLQRFAKAYPWAHLDIAGTAWKSGGAAKGATGRPVPLLLNYLLHAPLQKDPKFTSKSPIEAAEPAQAATKKIVKKPPVPVSRRAKL